ncbi:MAG: hypothetical protein E7446_00925 [Ruminococcaceae bacterium]|nr:hypothetical protein [Oscillospiraceae bacterium]
MALPSWLCESMIRPFLDAGVNVEFYSAFAPVENLKTDAVLVMDYFGYIRQQELPGYRGTVIRDITHSVFAKNHTDADYYFGSLRKWAGFWTGGFAWTADGRELPAEQGDDRGYALLRQQAMEAKRAYMAGEKEDKDFLQTFAAAEELLEQSGALGAEERDIQLAGVLDIDGMKLRRRGNAACLLRELADIAVFPQLQAEDCPLFVPIRVPEDLRDGLRRELIQQEIYCPVHWPLSADHKIREEDKAIYQQELSLICDQRYTVQDMKRIARVVNEFRKR